MNPPDDKVTAEARELAEKVRTAALVALKDFEAGYYTAFDLDLAAAVLAPVVAYVKDLEAAKAEADEEVNAQWRARRDAVARAEAAEREVVRLRDGVDGRIVQLNNARTILAETERERDALRAEVERLTQVQADFTAWQTSVIATIGGTVDGYATGTGNYLQRLRDLVAVEAEKREWILGTAKLACRNTLLEGEVADLRAQLAASEARHTDAQAAIRSGLEREDALKSQLAAAQTTLQLIVDKWDFDSELFTSDGEAAQNLADTARKALAAARREGGAK